MELVLGYKKEAEGRIFTKNNYEVIPPEGIYTLDDGTYVASKNGEYEFTVKILNTGEEIKEKVIVDELNDSEDIEYEVLINNETYTSAVGLGNISTKTFERFEKAWIQYNGKRIDVSDYIITRNDDFSFTDEEYHLDGEYSYIDFGGLESFQDLTRCTVIIIKDGKAYFRTITISTLL